MEYSHFTIDLYENHIPGNKPGAPAEIVQEKGRIAGVTVPTLSAYLAEAGGTPNIAVIICPGGGYHRVAMEHEGHEVAKALCRQGISAFVLKYRTPSDYMVRKEIIPLMDLQRALQLVRINAGEWKVDPQKTGVMGFSSGGHLASTAATHFLKPVIANEENVDLRPDFMLLCYPVITLNAAAAHEGSRENLLGKNASSGKARSFSNELHVIPQTPPAFIMHAADDPTVSVENSLMFFNALIKKKVPAELHIYQEGGHGFGLHNPSSKEDWFATACHWIEKMK